MRPVKVSLLIICPAMFRMAVTFTTPGPQNMTKICNRQQSRTRTPYYITFTQKQAQSMQKISVAVPMCWVPLTKLISVKIDSKVM